MKRTLAAGPPLIELPPLFFLLLLLLFSVFFPGMQTPLFGQDSASASGIPIEGPDGGLNRLYMLHFLLSEDRELLDAEIRRLSAELENTRRDSRDASRIRFAIGALRVYRYTRFEEKDDAFTARDRLEASRVHFGDDYYHKAHLGMAHAYIAKIRRVFGISSLKEMRKKMAEIPDQHPDWLLRFLRGTTLVEVGSALPGVPTIRDIKESAVEVGSADLSCVLDRHGQTSVSRFDPATYDIETMPVPDSFAGQCRKLLGKVE